MEVAIRRAATTDAGAITELMRASSAYAGDYARILEGYAVTPEQILRDLVYVAEAAGRLVGFYSLVEGPEPELDLLFVAEGMHGGGLGRRLFEHMRAQAARRGIAAVKVVSHPPAVGFYERVGAVAVAVKPASGKVTWERTVLNASTQSAHST